MEGSRISSIELVSDIKCIVIDYLNGQGYKEVITRNPSHGIVVIEVK